jgi:4-hydroxybenzoate polyprenyltransferase
VSIPEALALLAGFTLLYYVSAYLICLPALLYATPLYILAMLYPYAKRVHPLPHIHLGLVLGLAVFGGWVAGSCSRGCYDTLWLLVHAPWLIVAGVTLWVAGFDTVYAVMDYEVDKRLGIYSLPVALGPRRALYAALAMEITSAILWCLGGLLYSGLYAALSSLAAGVVAAYSVVVAMRGRIPEAFKMNLAVGFIALPGYIPPLVY